MSYRYPHPDDSDEGDFAETVPQPSLSGVAGEAAEDSEDSDHDVFSPATEALAAQYLAIGDEDVDDDDEDEEDDEDEDDDDEEYHGNPTISS